MKINRMKHLSSLLFSSIIVALAIALLIMGCNASIAEAQSGDVDSNKEEIMGPENLMKTLPTPFTTKIQSEGGNTTGEDSLTLNPIGISAGSALTKRNSLSERFHGPKLFLPSRMVLGQCSEFIVRGNPGSYVAIAMADKNTGAKPIYGHSLRLGPDRKLVAVGKISEQGMVPLSIEMPIEGDLVGSPIFFEAVVWSKPDFSDMQLALPIATEKVPECENGVLVYGQQEAKKDNVFVLDLPKPMSLTNVGTMSSGRP